MKHLVFLAVLSLATAGCASETFTVTVVDFDNVAVTDAVVTVKAMNKVVLLGVTRQRTSTDIRHLLTQMGSQQFVSAALTGISPGG